MAHTALEWSHGRGTITVDGVTIPRVLSISMDLSASDPLGVITIRVLADEVTAQVEADTVVTTQPEQRIDDLNDQLAKLNAELAKLDLLNAQVAKRIADGFNVAGSTKGLALLVRQGEQHLMRDSGRRFAKGGAIQSSEHTWVDATTMNDQAENQTAELCTRCGHGRVTKHGRQYGGGFPCDGVSRPEPEHT